MKELAEEFDEQFNCLRGNTEKYKTFLVPVEELLQEFQLQELVRMEKNLQKLYFIDHNLLIAQDLWQGHYQNLLIILLKEFIKLNVNMYIIIKNLNRMGLYTNITSVSLNIQMIS